MYVNGGVGKLKSHGDKKNSDDERLSLALFPFLSDTKGSRISCKEKKEKEKRGHTRFFLLSNAN